MKIKAGAITAFGNLHKVPVIIDKELTKAKKAVFSSGSLNHSIEMATKDYVKLENAVLSAFGIKKIVKKQKMVKPKKSIARKKEKKAVTKKK